MMPPLRGQAPQPSWKTLLTAAVVCFVISALVATVEVALNRGFGASDILPFLYWSLPFAALIALIKAKLTNTLHQLSILLRYAVAAAIGIAGGALWTYIVAFFLGAWFGAFSFPVVSCWIAAGASGMVAGTSSYRKRVELTIVATLCLGSVIMPKYLFDLSKKNQRLEVVSVRWKPGSEPLTVQDGSSLDVPDNFRLSNEDLARLESLGLTGQVTFGGSSGFIGRGKPARVLIVMQRQLKEPVELLQPDGVEVIYIQGIDGWKMYPSDAPTLQRTIRLWADEQAPTWATLYSIERADGTRQGGTLFTW